MKENQVFKEVFKRSKTNTSALNAGIVLPIQFKTEALKSNYLPHNALIVTNTDTTSVLFLFLDDYNHQETPDYVLFPQQTISVDVRDGVSFTTLFIKNTHATNNILANKIKYRIATVRLIDE